ncbi:hypothetical protein [Streptomyces qinzhouensis]|uniref:PLL-like beta propeller domain-containing protein n=1 Tax=Streptomyces qinzhouensis TaxID=2599401 RepID=A0A5B8JFX3_9ACTN|nr:hypothetical protein [Streptomyces qinzhouensis]QDY80386.1 hypothetical protein FQU76_32085 [Streptomyces qinzhouensis]
MRTALRRWHTAVIAMAAALLLLITAPTAATAAEENWQNLGGQATAQSALYSVVIGGNQYEVVRGSDSNVWFRYNGGAWQPLGGFAAARTASPPRIIEYPPGRALVVIRGMNSELFYSQANAGSANFWTSWSQLSTGAWAMGSPWLSLSEVTGRLRIDAPRYDGRINYMYSDAQNGNLVPGRDWTYSQGFQLAGNSRDIEGQSQIALWGYGYPEWQSYFTGPDNRVYRARTDQRNGQVTSVGQVPGGAVCNSGVAASRLGNPGRVVPPGAGGYANQQRILITCIGSDGLTWINISSNGGDSWEGWRQTSGGAAPSSATPAVNSTYDTWTLTIRWNGARSTLFPNDALVGKRIR